MWCWHRIRESESGLCPACRTPYGDDPHEFSAVDVEEVLKANKEKEAAAKRERERQRQQNDGNSSDGEGIGGSTGGSSKGQMDVPKDRTQLANMRVIRRNLVYAVGLPPTVANEDTLRKPEYFGQYGKISKIVLNRSQTTGSDLRRSSASAYVTFFHKEDTLSCILALDGFYLEGRNIRASYGTSKYCSAFIKNVRCNNPECTYLHQMGDVEDTFTKQEIQAGYVTSGRDVLARQQQIVQQALSAASGAAGSTPRRKAGGGGPSGTGRASSNPVFPTPTYDEPTKPSTTNLVPPPAGHQRAVTTGSAFPTISAANGSAPSNSITRASSGGLATTTGGFAVSALKGSIGSTAQLARKGVIGASGLASSNAMAPSGATAASVVAGVHSVSGSNESPAPHTTLTPLTPLKRSSGSSKGNAKLTTSSDISNDFKGLNHVTRPSNDMSSKLTSLRVGGGKKQNAPRTAGSAPGSPLEAQSAVRNHMSGRSDGPSIIGGSVIAAPVAVASLHGVPVGNVSQLGGDGLGGLGGEVFNGPLKASGKKTAIGSGKDRWNSTPIGGDPMLSANPGGLWTNGSSGAPSHGFGTSMGQVSGGVIGGPSIGGGFHNSGSSALASMLGINLPTGSGSLRESPNNWDNSTGQPPIAALNGTSVPVQGVIGPGASSPTNGLIGGVTIGGGHSPMSSGAIGSGGNKSDMALLQSLLPGVQITSGGYNQGSNFGTIGGGGNGEWNSTPGPTQMQQRAGNANLRMGDPRQQPHWEGGLQSSLGGQPVGAVGQSAANQPQRPAPGSIW